MKPVYFIGWLWNIMNNQDYYALPLQYGHLPDPQTILEQFNEKFTWYSSF